jgi:epsilon-lactone hydrolase
MTSFGAKTIFALLHVLRRKRIYASVDGLTHGIKQTRRDGPARPTAAMHKTLHIAEETLANRTVYRVRSRARPTPQARVIYFHGGAYVRPITSFHWRHLAALAHDTGCEYVVPLYPLAPESHGLAALEFAQQVYRRESALGDRIVLMGDSAGAGLALALAAAVRDAGERAARRLILLTPWVDVELTHPDAHAIEPTDPMLGRLGVLEAGRLYAGALPTSHPAISPARGDLQGLPAMTLFVAGRDILGPDALAFAEQARSSGCEVDVHFAQEMMHAWALLGFAESRAARAAIALATAASCMD